MKTGAHLSIPGSYPEPRKFQASVIRNKYSFTNTKLIFSNADHGGPVGNPNRFTLYTFAAVRWRATILCNREKHELLLFLALNNSGDRRRLAVGRILDMNFIQTANITYNGL